tara:strand:- start:8988 stop:9212 length:225 start_codon:yes stop_codon:yes gene_type:complete
MNIMSKTKQIDPIESVALPTQIDNAERDYLNTLLAQAQTAQLVMNNFSSYIAQKYRLNDGDTVTPDGQIVVKKD